LPAVAGLSHLAALVGTRILLPTWLLAGTATITIGIALISGAGTLRSLRHAEPALLLR
jgi:hypothetical protein